MIALTRFTKAGAVALVLGVGVTSPCLADPYLLGNLANFAVFGFSFNPQFNVQLLGPATINGNVGLGNLGALTLGGAGVNISGKIYYAGALITSGAGDNFNASGG